MPKRIKSDGTRTEQEIFQFAKGLVQYHIQGFRESKVYERFKRNREYYLGQHKVKKRDPRKGTQVWNKCAERADTIISHLTDAEIKWKFLPQEEGDVANAHALNQILGDVVWDKSEWEDRSEDSLVDAAFAGSTHIKTLKDAKGFPDFVVCPCGTVLPDPRATSPRTCMSMVHLIVKSVMDIKRDYDVDVLPEPNLDKVVGTLEFDNIGITWEQQSSTSYTMENVWKKAGYPDGWTSNSWMPEKIGRALIAEIYVQDNTEERIPYDPVETDEEHQLFLAGQFDNVMPEENHVEHIKAHTEFMRGLSPDMQPNALQNLQLHLQAHSQYDLTEKRAKYPGGRVIAICQDKLLRDEAFTLLPSWRMLFTKYDYKKVPNSYWGKSLFEDLIDPQDALNHRKNSITVNINNLNTGVSKLKMGIYSKLFGSNEKKYDDVNGMVIPVTNENDLTRDFGPPLPVQFFQDLMHDESFMDKLTGDEILSGRYPSGSPPMGAVDQMLNEGKTPLRNVLKHYGSALRQMARNAIYVVTTYLDDETKFRIIGQDNNPQMINWAMVKPESIYDIRIIVVANMNTTRTSYMRQALELRNAGVYDNQAVLEAIDDPKKAEVIQRVSEIAQLQMAVKGMVEELQKRDREINTMQNRMQGEQGEGNVGSKKSVR